MSQRQARQGAGVLTLVVLLVVVFLVWKVGEPGTTAQPSANKVKARPAGNPVTMPAQGSTLLVALGLKSGKKNAETWHGEVTLSEGKVTKTHIVQGKGTQKKNTFTVAPSAAKKKKKQGFALPKVRIDLDAPATAKVTLRFEQGVIEVPLAELKPGAPKLFLKGKVSVEREAAVVRLTDTEPGDKETKTEDDYPVLARAADGKLWLVYNEFQKGKGFIKERVLAGNFEELVPTDHGDQLRMKSFDGKTWSPCLDVTAPGLDIWRPTVCVDKAGVVHVAWSQWVDGNYDIYHRSYTPGAGTWSKVARVCKEPGSDYHVVAATDSNGVVWLAWQGWRDGNFHILTAQLKDGSWQAPKQITSARANHWSPAIAADSKGNVYLVYDTYENDNYDVRLHTLPAGKTIDVAKTPRFEARAHVAVDGQDRVWIAYEEGDEQWGKDYANNTPKKVAPGLNPGFPLYLDRTVRVKCLADGKLLQPAQSIDEACKETLPRNKSVPRLAVDKDGGVWLTFRHHPLLTGAGEVWDSYVLRYAGKRWSGPRQLPYSENLMDNRPAMLAFGPGVVVVFSGDNRVRSANRGQNDLFATLLTPDGEKGAPQLVTAKDNMGTPIKTVHPNERAEVARMREYRIDHGDKKLHLMRGEFHRHTEYGAHRDQDGMLEDAWRYGLDAAHHDWIGIGDHDNGFGEIYPWWQFQKMTELCNNPSTFVAVHCYERSNLYPNGHRNVIMPKRGIRPLPRGSLKGSELKGTPDTKILYAYLKRFGGMCASHTSATSMGTDWRDNDPLVEPVVEIYQGHRHNYEHFGAPRSPTKATNIGGYEPKGFVWNALEKGYKLGFQSSSDHVSTHMSYAVVLTDDISRKGIIDAFKKRHSYGATDNIILDVRSEDYLQGDQFETAKMPALDIYVRGTAPISKISVVRNNKYVYSDKPNKEEVKIRFTDAEPLAGQVSFYYVRIEQADGNLAWASPMWITYRPK